MTKARGSLFSPRVKFKIINLIPAEIRQQLLEYSTTVETSKAQVFGNNNVVSYIPNERSTTVHHVRHTLFPQINNLLESYCNDGTKVIQYDVLTYNKGDKFVRHTDIIPGDPEKRKWTTVTMLEKNNLVGGKLTVMNSDPIDLAIGETIVFRSHLPHEALEVKSGTRKVLVAWLG